MIPIILDTDIGDDVDDAFALAYAIRHPQIDLRAVTTVLGDTRWRAALALRLLDELDASTIPVAAGTPGGERWPVALSGDVVVPPGTTDTRCEARPAWALMAEVLTQASEPVWLVTIGPATNAARLIEMHPDSVDHLAGIVMMGGRHEPVMTREHNFGSDPTSAAVTCNSGLDVRVGDYVITSQAQLRRSDLPRVQNIPGVGTSLAAMLETYLNRRGRGWTSMYDPAALTLAISEDFLSLDPSPMRATIVDEQIRFEGARRGARGLRLAATIDAEGFHEHLLEIIDHPARPPAEGNPFGLSRSSP